MQAKEIGKKIYITSLHDYIYGDKAVIQSRDYLSASKTKENISSSIEKIQEKVHTNREEERKRKVNDFYSLMQDKKLSQQFRCALRKLNASNLETLLFGNTSDDVKSSYILPDDDDISQLFLAIDKEYCFFAKDKIANKQFVVFFLMCKIIADFFEKNNDEKNTVAAEHAYKLLVFFGYNENGNPFTCHRPQLLAHPLATQSSPLRVNFFTSFVILHFKFWYKFFSIRLPIKNYFVGFIDHAIQGGIRHNLIIKYFHPALYFTIRCYNEHRIDMNCCY